MKKALSILFTLIVTAYIAEANLLSNPGFETPAATMDFAGTGWTAGGSGAPGRESWAARSGSVATNKGGYAPGWSGPNDTLVYQDVPVTAGKYTFSIWVRQEEGFTCLSNEVRIGWYNAGNTLLQESKATFTNTVSDDQWHHLFVTGTCADGSVSYARATYYTAYGTPGGGGTAAFFDDADFYAGDHVGTPLENVSFERVSSDADAYWRASKWHNLPDLGGGNKYAFENWANHSGGWGIGLWGWDVADLSNSVSICQNLAPGTGTFSFVCYIQRETDFYLSNAVLRLEWFDRTFTNKICPDTFTNLVVPNDFAWHEYSVTGTCNSNDLYEVRASVFIEWWENVNPGVGHALKIDDARFLSGLYNGVSLTENWSYHASPDKQSSLESLPGTNLGAFLQVDYVAKTSTLYVIAPADGFASYPGEGSVVGMRTSFQRPENLQYVTAFVDMTPVGKLTIPAGMPFHGLPAAGVQTQMLWCHRMEFPRDISDVYYTTNIITVFYAPYLRTTNVVGGETDRRYLVSKDAQTTNNLGQLFHEVPEDRDYSFRLNPAQSSELRDPSFESPASTDFVGSPWGGFGGVGRETWAARTGARGGRFDSWQAGSGGVFQDVAANGGTRTFSIWVKRPLGANLTAMELKLEWFNSAAQMMFAETNSFIPPADEKWHRLCLTSTLPAGESLFVRPVLFAAYSAGSYPYHEATFYDDAELYSGGFTSRQAFMNGGFERDSDGLINSFWDGVLSAAPFSNTVSRETWAARSGTWGGAFRGFELWSPNAEGSISQALNVPTGTYVFSAWILAEDSILLTNAHMRIDWLKKDLTPAQASTVLPLNLPLDNTWHFYAVTGTCGNADLFEVRPLLLAQWDANLGGGNKAIKIDDVSFGMPGDLDDDGDGLPNGWELLYFGSTTGADPGAHGDADPALNGEEYVADTNPTNGASYFPNVITNHSGFGVLTLWVGPPTTNSRVYDAWWNTNLVTGQWMPLNRNVPGQPDGGPVVITVTNDQGRPTYYITGVKLP